MEIRTSPLSPSQASRPRFSPNFSPPRHQGTTALIGTGNSTGQASTVRCTRFLNAPSNGGQRFWAASPWCLGALVVELQCPGSVQMRRFTQKELARYNGKDGVPAFIAYAGRVYDVSGSFLWQEGSHQALHAAGRDLTGSLDDAPHAADLLRRFPMVGTLREDSPPCGP